MSRKFLNGLLTTAFQLGTSATSGQVLTTDSSGNGTWQSSTTGITRSVSSVSTATSAGSTSATDYVYFVSGTTTLTLPTAVSNTNKYNIVNSGTNTITVATTSSQTINSPAVAVTSLTLTAGQSMEFISNNANWWIF